MVSDGFGWFPLICNRMRHRNNTTKQVVWSTCASKKKWLGLLDVNWEFQNYASGGCFAALCEHMALPEPSVGPPCTILEVSYSFKPSQKLTRFPDCFGLARKMTIKLERNWQFCARLKTIIISRAGAAFTPWYPLLKSIRITEWNACPLHLLHIFPRKNHFPNQLLLFFDPRRGAVNLMSLGGKRGSRAPWEGECPEKHSRTSFCNLDSITWIFFRRCIAAIAVAGERKNVAKQLVWSTWASEETVPPPPLWRLLGITKLCFWRPFCNTLRKRTFCMIFTTGFAWQVDLACCSPPLCKTLVKPTKKRACGQHRVPLPFSRRVSLGMSVCLAAFSPFDMCIKNLS